MRNLYEQTDKSLTQIKQVITKAYKHLIHLAFDEITAVTAGKIARKIYVVFLKENKKQYKKIADDALEYAFAFYEELQKEYGKDIPYDEKKIREKITADKAVQAVLTEYNPVTGYLYEREAERKEARLTEGMIAGKKNNDRDFYRKTVETNTNLWYTQSKQYAEDVADNTVIMVWKEIGVKKIRWVTAGDEKVCNECRPLDGKIFDIDKVPPKPHYRCRCLKVPVIVKEEVLTPKGE